MGFFVGSSTAPSDTDGVDDDEDKDKDVDEKEHEMSNEKERRTVNGDFTWDPGESLELSVALEKGVLSQWLGLIAQWRSYP